MRSQLLLVPAALVLAAAPAIGLDFQTLEAGQKNLFPNATFVPLGFTLSEDQLEKLKTDYEVPVMHREVKAWKVSTGGWLFLDQVYGLNDTISYLIAITDKGVVSGIEVLVCVEGFCDVAAPEWHRQFVGKKEGKWVPKADIKNISGSTLSAMHIAEGVKKTLAIHAKFMPKK